MDYGLALPLSLLHRYIRDAAVLHATTVLLGWRRGVVVSGVRQ